MISSMKLSLEHAVDFRQNPYWGEYMKKIGWQIERIEEIQLCIRRLPLLGTFIKIQHPHKKIPFKKIDMIAKKYNTTFLIIEPTHYKYSETVFKKNGYVVTRMHHAPTATRKLAIDLPLSKIIASFSENAKRNLRKAEKNNLKIKTVFAKEDKTNEYFELFFRLQKHLTDLKKFYAPGYTESYKKNEALKKTSFFSFAYDPGNKNEPIATVWYGVYEGVITYLQTGITQKGYEYLANYALVLEGIKVGKKLGCTVFDFESMYDPRYPSGVAKRWKGFSEFKSRFHGQEIFYPPSWIKIYNPYFRWFYILSSPFIS